LDRSGDERPGTDGDLGRSWFAAGKNSHFLPDIPTGGPADYIERWIVDLGLEDVRGRSREMAAADN
jgi:hypothetical protein